MRGRESKRKEARERDEGMDEGRETKREKRGEGDRGGGGGRGERKKKEEPPKVVGKVKKRQGKESERQSMMRQRWGSGLQTTSVMGKINLPEPRNTNSLSEICNSHLGTAIFIPILQKQNLSPIIS